MLPINGFIVIALIATGLYLGCMLSFLGDYETSKCEMTYMFEYPQFVRVKTPVDDDFRKYGLYAYSEGRLTEKARNMKFDGIPVLFIPGSAGSHKQVRSLSSIALRKALNSRKRFHFDYFTLDLNNELSGLNGAVLEEQMKFANHSIHAVLNLYKVERNIILIGHSMGGIIAKALVAQLPPESNRVPILLTLAAPLKRPVVELDYYFRKFYDNINFNTSSQTTFVSIAGGFNDFLMPTYLTVDSQAHINVVATAVPKCWTSTDHLSILWCKQLILAINRALFDLVDQQTGEITLDHAKRLQVFRQNLVKHSGISSTMVERYDEPLSINNHGEWYATMSRQYSVRLPRGTTEPKWYMIPLFVEPRYESATVVALNMKAVDWAYSCPAISMRGTLRVCDIGRHLTHVSEISPSVMYKRRTLRIDLAGVKNNYTSATHVVVRVMPTEDPVVLHFDIYSPRDRNITVTSLPKWFTYTKQTIIERTEDKAIHYDLNFPDLSYVLQSYLLYVESSECTGHTSHATASLIVPWGRQDLHDYVTDVDKKPMNMRLYTSRPTNMAHEHATIRLTLDPTCRYKISIKNTYQFGNIARYYSPLLLANVAAVILMTLRCQLKNIGETERCSIFFIAIKEGAKPYYIVTAIKIISKVLSGRSNFLPPSDWQVLADDNLDFIVLTLVLYIISVGFVWMLALFLSVSFVFYESTFHKLAFKFISKTFSRNATWTDHIMKTFENLPGVVAAILMVISMSASGGLAMCLATGFYFMKLTQMSQDYIEDLVKGIVKSIGKKLSNRVVEKLLSYWPKARGLKIIAVTTGSKENEATTPVETADKACEVTRRDLRRNVQAAKKDKRRESKGRRNQWDDGLEIRNDDGLELKEEGLEVSKEDIGLEKPMELEVCTKDDTIQKINGEKLLKFLEARTDLQGEMREEVHEKEDKGNEKEDSILPDISFDWIREIMENNEIFFHFTIFLLYFVVAALNTPSVLTWAHNFKYSRHLDPDPARYPALILSTCALLLWQLDLPRVNLKFYNELSHVVYASAVISLIFGLVSIYRLSFILSLVVTMVTLHQMLATKKPEAQTPEAIGDATDSYRSRVKSKLE